MHDAAVLRAVI